MARAIGTVLVVAPAIAVWAPAPRALAQEPPAGRPDLRALHDLVNALRDRSGCPPLGWSAKLAAVARAHSRDMASRDYFDHAAPDGSLPADRLERAGIRSWGAVAENIALTPAGPASAFELWRDSPPHRRNLLYCAFTVHGIGRSGDLWTEDLAAGVRPSAQR
jgi:uncharacterized protein YkwD